MSLQRFMMSFPFFLPSSFHFEFPFSVKATYPVAMISRFLETEERSSQTTALFFQLSKLNMVIIFGLKVYAIHIKDTVSFRGF